MTKHAVQEWCGTIHSLQDQCIKFFVDENGAYSTWQREGRIPGGGSHGHRGCGSGRRCGFWRGGNVDDDALFASSVSAVKGIGVAATHFVMRTIVEDASTTDLLSAVETLLIAAAVFLVLFRFDDSVAADVAVSVDDGFVATPLEVLRDVCRPGRDDAFAAYVGVAVVLSPATI